MMTRFAVWFATAAVCFAQDNPCTIAKRNGSTLAHEILQKIADKVPFSQGSFFLYESQAPLVKGRTVSYLCNESEKWILYDPQYIEESRRRDGGSVMPFELALAHMTAHHQLDHTLFNDGWSDGYFGPGREIDADLTAAKWIARLQVPEDDCSRPSTRSISPCRRGQTTHLVQNAARR